MDFTSKRVTVIGLGKSGIAVAKLLARNGCRVKITEAGDQSSLRLRAEEMKKIGISAELGGHREDFYSDAQWMVPCPGVKPDAGPLQWAKRNRIPILSEMEVAYRFTPCPVIGITGTNGKTTTTTLIGRILASAGWKVRVGGNIGTPLSDFAAELAPQHWVVLEISSFQLEYIERFRPKIAVLLNMTTNHLDHHQNKEEYFAMKARITECQRADDWLILNAKDERLRKVAEKSRAGVLFFNGEGDTEYANDNFKAAAAVAKVLGIPEGIVSRTLRDFKGIEHRLEEVLVVDGVRFINDSKSTSVDSLRWALQNLPAPVHLIAGGRDKGGDFTELNEFLRQKVRRIILIGEAAEKLRKDWSRLEIPVELACSLKESAELAYRNSPAGTSVLLSPGCASFDMFQSYEDRGNQFKRVVMEISKRETANAPGR
ncbi:MAG: UDP-N-acetylmuramoyl-L-alanine--D-glutamate ligase [Candidatus Omnitrophica bacterium]|nr:UDP-N-acetylmuramoyl-L-alanine--D-glutamate ligase [Candidatus Omnitrophota bacterium]